MGCICPGFWKQEGIPKMEIEKTSLEGLLVLKPKVFGDERGYFFETWHQQRYDGAGAAGSFVQDNVSFSRKGIVRGLHFQNPHGQGKLITVLAGEVFDVAVDIRVGSPTFGKSFGIKLTQEKHLQLYIPPGFAHGFCVMSETALFSYKCTDFYHPEVEKTILWNDSKLGIDWPSREPILSEKDGKARPLEGFSKDELPQFAG